MSPERKPPYLRFSKLRKLQHFRRIKLEHHHNSNWIFYWRARPWRSQLMILSKYELEYSWYGLLQYQHITITMIELLLYLIAFALAIGLIWLIYPYRSWKTTRKNEQSQQITIITADAKRHRLADFQAIQPEAYLSLVVPSYNEQVRLPVMLEETAQFLKKKKYTYEIIIVNDGSKDRTTQVALETSKRLSINTVVVEYPKNRGKGGAVRAGVEVSKGQYVLMVDADGATRFSDFTKLQEKIKDIEGKKKDTFALVVGSRRAEEQQGKVQRKFHRRFVSFVFKTIINILLGIKTKDTQCGFKLFNKQTAKVLFKIMHINRFAFDVQLFFISNQLKVETAEVGVEWHDVDGSKLTVLDASINMLRDVLVIRLYYLLSLWKISDRYEVK